MIIEVPQYGLRAYSLFYFKHGSREPFMQRDLDWIVGQSMKKKIFSLLVRSGWIEKVSRTEYRCVRPEAIIRGILEFKVPEIIKLSKKPYAFTGLSAIEIWSDYAYVQRGIERSPYFIKVLKKDLRYWKDFLNKNNIPYYINGGSTIGEYIILIPVEKLKSIDQGGLRVEPLRTALKNAKGNKMYSYAYDYMRGKYAIAPN